jgi:hypothetical protein
LWARSCSYPRRRSPSPTAAARQQETLQEALLLLHSVAYTQGSAVRLVFEAATTDVVPRPVCPAQTGAGYPRIVDRQLWRSLAGAGYSVRTHHRPRFCPAEWLRTEIQYRP